MFCLMKEQEQLVWQVESWNLIQEEIGVIEEVMATIGGGYQEAYNQKEMSRGR